MCTYAYMLYISYWLCAYGYIDMCIYIYVYIYVYIRHMCVIGYAFFRIDCYGVATVSRID